MNYQKQNGVSGYSRSGNYAWEFYPPPYDFLSPPDAAPQPPPIMRGRSIAWGVGDYQRQAFATPQVLTAPMRDASIAIPNGWGGVTITPPVLLTPDKGLSGCGCGGSCGGCGDDHHHAGGLGLFESGFDYTKWSYPEWGFVAVGGYLALSVVRDMFSAGRVARKGYKAARRPFDRAKARKAAKAKYQSELALI